MEMPERTRKEKIIKTREANDDILKAGGAVELADGRLEITNDQLEEAHSLREEKQARYHERETIYGHEGKFDMILSWDSVHNEYVIYFPDIKIGNEQKDPAVPDQVISVGKDVKKAKSIYNNLFMDAAKLGLNPYETYKRLEQSPR